jgi:hypothetical protein
MAARHGDPREGGPEARLLVWSGNQDITDCSGTAAESRQISFDASSAASEQTLQTGAGDRFDIVIEGEIAGWFNPTCGSLSILETEQCREQKLHDHIYDDQ